MGILASAAAVADTTAQGGGPAVVLDPITVTGDTGDSANSRTAAEQSLRENFAVKQSFAATKSNAPVMEIPVSVQVVPRAILDDRKANSLSDAVQTVSGVGFMPVDGGVFNVFMIRGFVNDTPVFRNGLKTENFNYDTANLSSIEVLKGPAGMLYGRGQPGGLINLNTKLPLEEAYYSLEQQFGSYDYYRTVLDATGPIKDDKSLLYRANLAYQNNNSFRDSVFLERVLFAPTITWRPSDRAELNFGMEYQNDNFQRDDGIPAIGKRPAPIPISRFLNDPRDPNDNQSRLLLSLNSSYRFSDTWTLRNRFLALPYQYYQDRAIKPVSLLADNRTMDRNGVAQQTNSDYYATNLEVAGVFDTGWLHHDLLLGYDFYQKQETYRFRLYDPSPFANVDIYDPAVPPVDPASFQDWGNVRITSQIEERWHGLYFQDQIRLWEGVHFLGGGRYDWAENGRGDGSTDSLSSARANFKNNHNDRFNPRVGLLYRPVQWLSLYSNYTESLGSNNGRSSNGLPFNPETSTQYEAGIKTEAWDGRLISTLAFYHIIKENVLTADVSTADPFDQVAIGEARSQGIEFDLNGKLTESLSLTASYAWIDTAITKDTNGNQGNRLPLAPVNSGSVWAKYQFDQEPVRGLSLSIGTLISGPRYGDAANSFILPGYVRLDGALAYRFKLADSTLTAQLNMQNLLGKTYYAGSDLVDSADPRFDIIPGAPRSFLGSVRVEF